MTLRPEIVLARLLKLREVVRNLRDVSSVSRREYVKSFRHSWVAERGLQLAAEALFDVGNHILAGAFNIHPTDYEDVVRRLAEQQVISEELGRRLKGLGGFRNILVHGYLDVDSGRVHEFIQTRLDDFEQYATEIELFIDAQR